jgi:kynurenine---oxoglutarate transaminase / cysteine-S-conjugate beta-lyase / glutamine---phenylpyruvate transaminase
MLRFVRHFGSNRSNALSEQSIWTTMTPLAVKHNSVNLGQGFSNLPVAPFLRSAFSEALEDSSNWQYTRPRGHPLLCEQVSRYYSDRLGRNVDALRHVQICVGATQAIYLASMALLNPGDNAVLVEPYYDSYRDTVALADAKVDVVQLKPVFGCHDRNVDVDADQWQLDFESMAEALRDKGDGRTTMLFLNNPQNIPGKVYSRGELLELAALVRANERCVVLADEVYGDLVFDDVPMIPFASLPGMWERTVTLGSAGKQFSFTGAKTGYAIGPERLVSALARVHQPNVFCHATPIQAALAIALRHANTSTYFDELRADMRARRDRVSGHLRRLGLPALRNSGGFFMLTDMRQWPMASLDDDDDAADLRLAKHLTAEAKVTMIPISPFVERSSVADYEHYLRICFCKANETIDSGFANLERFLENSQ